MEALIETFKKYKYALGFTLIVVVGFVVYTIFFTGESIPAGDELITTSPAQSEVEAVTVDLLALLLSLKTLNIDTAIFADDRFKSLTDFSVELLQQPVGRENPFLPLTGTPPEGNSTNR